MYPEHIKHVYIAQYEGNNAIFKTGRRFEQTLNPKDKRISIFLKWCSTSLVTREIQIQIKRDYTNILIRMAKIFKNPKHGKPDNTKSWEEFRQQKHSCKAGGRQHDRATLGDSWAVYCFFQR